VLGLHIMEAQTEHWTETLTGLAATGVEAVLAHAGEHPLLGHPLVSLLQVSAVDAVRNAYGEDLDLRWKGDAQTWAAQALELLVEMLSRRYQPRARLQSNADFQFTRGLLGVSM
jgi:hypothetical protein